MSVTGIPQDHADRLLKKPFHRRNDSGELDVFEAARYFSGYNAVDASAGQNGSTFVTKDETGRGFRGRRISLDMPVRHVLNPSQVVNADISLVGKEKIKHNKQPSSPGGRLASFLNSLFSQSSAKKKKSKPSSMKDDDSLRESSGSRRKRRSSISYFPTSSIADSKSSSSSGFRTPPAYAQTPTKSYKEFKNLANKQINNITITTITTNTSCSSSNSVNGTHVVKLLASEDHVGEAVRDVPKESKNSGHVSLSEHEFVKFDDERDDGADSDSSSDLFELKNYDVGRYSSGLPVYETTNMESIKRGAPISSA